MGFSGAKGNIALEEMVRMSPEWLENMLAQCQALDGEQNEREEDFGGLF